MVNFDRVRESLALFLARRRSQHAGDIIFKHRHMMRIEVWVVSLFRQSVVPDLGRAGRGCLCARRKRLHAAGRPSAPATRRGRVFRASAASHGRPRQRRQDRTRRPAGTAGEPGNGGQPAARKPGATACRAAKPGTVVPTPGREKPRGAGSPQSDPVRQRALFDFAGSGRRRRDRQTLERVRGRRLCGVGG